jgi:AAA15 family ATPase/GTPase
LLRRDEIWFVEKEKNQSRLYSLDEFKVRNDKIVSKDYLLGRYGAIPISKALKI